MKKLFPALFALAIPALAVTDMEFNALKGEVDRLKGEVAAAKKQSAQDNLKFGADLRSSMDSLKYKFADKSSAENGSLFSNRLWVNMKFQPNAETRFFGQLAYNKIYGDSVENQRPGNFDRFDWITSESMSSESLNVRQAYFIYSGNLSENLPFNLSFGRRPSTNGLPAHYRDDDTPQSPLSHMINVEFDGASFQTNFEKLTGLTGAYVKLCLGRGVSNAKSRFSSGGDDFAKADLGRGNTDMAGIIIQPFYNGQYRVFTQFIRGLNLIGYEMDPQGVPYPDMRETGALNGASVAVVVEGIGESINDFLDNAKLFAAYSVSQTDPKSGKRMLGSEDKEIGSSFYVGAQIPAFWSSKGAIGVEFNRGDKYWRGFTYGEDTAIGSKLAARGSAYEIYYTQQINDALSVQARYTAINYDYTGSNAFFGDDGAPMKMSEALAMGQNPVEKASDLRLYIRYRY